MAFQKAILQQELLPSTKLPPSRVLCEHLGIARNTVKTAYEMLLAEGYIETRRGAGSFVSGKLPACKTVKPANRQIINKQNKKQTEGNPRIHSLLSPIMPDIQHFPWREWENSVTAAAHRMRHVIVNNGLGFIELRREVVKYLKAVRGVQCDSRQVMICSGSRQAISLSTQLLLQPGDKVLTEEPCYSGTTNSLKAAGAQCISVMADRHGFQTDQAITRAPDARMAILTPTRNHPVGHHLSLERRIPLIQWAAASGSWIIEDDYDSDFQYDRVPCTSLQGLGGQDCVLYTGSFSRILHPTIRIGFMVLPEALVETFSKAREYIDGGLSILPQIAMADFMSSGHFSRHVRKMRKLYKTRRDILHRLVQEKLGNLLQPLENSGGFHSVYLLLKGLSDKDICQEAAKNGLGILPLSGYYNKAPD